MRNGLTGVGDVGIEALNSVNKVMVPGKAELFNASTDVDPFKGGQYTLHNFDTVLPDDGMFKKYNIWDLATPRWADKYAQEDNKKGEFREKAAQGR